MIEDRDGIEWCTECDMEFDYCDCLPGECMRCGDDAKRDGSLCDYCQHITEKDD